MSRLLPRREIRGQTSPDPPTRFKSGCTTLDLVTGKWPLGRIVNIVGDESTGKTLLAIEASANFVKTFPNGKVWYREAEAAFDKEYAGSIGMPIDRVDFGKRRFDTVEDIFEDMEKKIEWAKENDAPGLYIIDSLDALSDREEQKRKIDTGTYGGNKPKKMGELFRRLIRKLEDAHICVMIISQVRDKIGVTFGQKKTRSGGRALNFYSSVILYLSHLGAVSKTYHKQKKAIGILVKVKCTKNKITKPFRDCKFLIRFDYGIDDIHACLTYLELVGRLSEVGIRSGKEARKVIAEADSLEDAEFKELSRSLSKTVRSVWKEVETSFLPKRRKYA